MSFTQPTALPERLIRPVICIGVPNGENVGLLPFMCVDFYMHGQRSKRVLINWTYGKTSGAESQHRVEHTDEIIFDGDLGRMKLFQLQSLQTETTVEVRFMLPSERGRQLSERIREVIERSKDGARVLFVIPKAVSDSEFYAALSIVVNQDAEVQVDEQIMGDPILSLRELGLTIDDPFIEVDPRQLG